MSIGSRRPNLLEGAQAKDFWSRFQYDTIGGREDTFMVITNKASALLTDNASLLLVERILGPYGKLEWIGQLTTTINAFHYQGLERRHGDGTQGLITFFKDAADAFHTITQTAGGVEDNAIAGADWSTNPVRFAIEWNPTSILFRVNDVLVATHVIRIPAVSMLFFIESGRNGVTGGVSFCKFDLASISSKSVVR